VLFPEWADRARPLAGLLLAGVPGYFLALLYFGGSPHTTDVGYSPDQPVPFSHQVHAGQMGLDCRYCHTTVETAAFAAVPPTSVCMNCHRTITRDGSDLARESTALELLRQSAATGDPVRWVRVHDQPDYVYFDHSAHVTRGVSCVSCHGRIDTMEQVYQVETLSMGWCLDCHRDPAPHLRPVEFVTDLGWDLTQDSRIREKNARDLGERLMREGGISPSVDCSTCHR
jgi:hypothetical protein